MLFGHLAYPETQKKAQWRDLNQCEDWERIAHLKHLGCRILGLEFSKLGKGKDGLNNKWFENSSDAGETIYEREGRYVKGRTRFALRLLNYLADEQRGLAYKSFSDFYAQSRRRNLAYFMVFLTAFALAYIKQVYEYDKKLNNKEYVLDTR